MKKIILLILALALCFTLAACGQSSGQSAEETESADDGQNPVMNFIGDYGCGRATMHVEAEGADGARFTLTWASSAAENTEWVMSGTFDEKTLSVEYSDCVRTDYVYNEDGSVKSQKEKYTDGHGVIQFSDSDELSLTWQDDQENAGEDMTFEYASYGGAEE